MKYQVKQSFRLAVLAIGALALFAALMAGCASKLSGDQNANQKPTVWFVNVPPEGAQSSVNPIINWVGQDGDGQVEYFRYVVIREQEIGEALGKPGGWLATAEPLTETELTTYATTLLGDVVDTMWTYLYVDATAGDPQTSNIIPMSAEISNPVLQYVPQVVFVQAVDEAGLGSDYAFRRFLRNDNPPETRIIGFIDGSVFINAAVPTYGGSNTGVRMRWQGTDVLDYPTQPPPFEYEWRVYGPYTDSVFDEMMATYIVPVFVTNDAQVFRFGEPSTDSIISSIECDTLTGLCDTFWIPFQPSYIVCDSAYVDGELVESCDTIQIDTIQGSNAYGTLDTLLRFFDDDFVGSEYDRIAAQSDNGFGSEWVTATQDSIFNVFKDYPSASTQKQKFLFWVRCRDDALVPDLTPDFVSFDVVDPRYERDILVIDMGRPASVNRINAAYPKKYWQETVQLLQDENPDFELEFDSLYDYLPASQNLQNTEVLSKILGHKVMVLFSDDVQTGVLTTQSSQFINWIYTGLESGVGGYLAARCPIGPLGSGYGEGALPAEVSMALPNLQRYMFYFGTEYTVLSGWSYYALLPFITGDSAIRIEDFKGTWSLNTSLWPDLSIDTALLHANYRWSGPGGPYEWKPELGALPEVNWAVRTFQTTPMYLYRSLYGAEHPLGAWRNYDGRPVMHRLNRGTFRTMHALFTPYTMEQTTMRQTLYRIFAWLYEGWALTHSAAKGDPTAKGAVSQGDLSKAYWDAYWQANGDAETFLRLRTE